MASLPTISPACPDNGAALAYARAQLATVDGFVAVCGVVDSVEAPGIARDVLFTLEGEHKPRRFVIWNEGGALYGEW